MKLWIARIAAGVLVLAFGIALGAGPLQHSAEERDQALARAEARADRDKEKVAEGEAAAALAAAYADATAPSLVAGKLAGRTVTVVTLPGADQAQVDALKGLITAAGGTVSAEAGLEPAALDPAGRSLIEALTSQLVTQNPSTGVPADVAGYDRLGALLARTVAADAGAAAGGAPYDQTAVGLAAGLQAAELVKVGKASPRGQLTVVVAGPPAESEIAAANNEVPLAILRGYGARTPTVLVGTSGAAGPNGLVGALRADPGVAAAVSGVDSLESSTGRVAAVLALAARAGGTIGQYGAVGASGGPVPPS